MKILRTRAICPYLFATLALCLCAGSGWAQGQSGAKQAESLGRLFFTPQQRQELDRRRQLNIQEAIVVRESRFTVNGQVSRSNGKTTTWINGTPVNELYRPRDPATIPIRTGEGEPSVPVKVGQTLDKGRGEILDGLAGGKVEARAPARR